MSEQATLRVHLKPATKEKLERIKAELYLLGDGSLKLQDVLDRALSHYLGEVEKRKMSAA
jgi:hypothetical protein